MNMNYSIDKYMIDFNEIYYKEIDLYTPYIYNLPYQVSNKAYEMEPKIGF